MKPQTLLWVNSRNVEDRQQEEFADERALCERIVALHEARPELTFAVGDLDHSTWVFPEDVAQRLAMINARREAVAGALAKQQGISEPSPWAARKLRLQADELIAAYEGAKP